MISEQAWLYGQLEPGENRPFTGDPVRIDRVLKKIQGYSSLNNSMKSIKEYCEIIRQKYASGSHFGETIECDVEVILTDMVDDILQVVKNMNETSLSQKDREMRAKELYRNYGIPTKNLM